jgi:sigma-B regulation protein RsbU (phosphoserine phosphatase)
MTGLMVCDVAGKGISAALLAAEIRFATRLETQQCLRFPGKVLQGVNAKLYDDLKRTERFATAMLVSVPEHETVLYYANAGHTTALWLQTDPLDVKHLPSQTLPLGVLPHIEDISVPIELKPNDVLVMYSDGLLEAENEQGQILGLTELKGVLLAARSTPTQFILDSLLKTYREHRGDAPITDDLTLLVLKQKAASTQTAKYLIRLRWPSDFSVLPDVETKLNRLRSYLPKTNQTHIWLSEIQLALTEVVTNIIKYSYRQNTGIIHGLIALYADRLQIDFFDFGEPYQPRDLPPLNFDPTDPPSGGYGLYIIHNVMDNVIYTRLPVECNHWHFTRTLPVEELDSGGIP